MVAESFEVFFGGSFAIGVERGFVGFWAAGHGGLAFSVGLGLGLISAFGGWCVADEFDAAEGCGGFRGEAVESAGVEEACEFVVGCGVGDADGEDAA